MAEIAFKPGVMVRKSAAKKAAARKTATDRKHRGQPGAIKVIGQTAAVAGLSGALLLGLKAMVLVAPSVLPHGNGLDSLGRATPSAGAPGIADTAPISLGSALAAAPVAGVSEHTAAAHRYTGGLSTRVSDAGTTAGSTAGTSGDNTGTYTPTSTNTGGGGGNTAPSAPGPVSGTLDTVGNTVKSLPAVGGTLGGAVDTVKTTTAPVVGAADTVVKSVTGDSGTGQVVSKTVDTVTKAPVVDQVTQSAPVKTVTDTATGLTNSLGLGL